MYLEGGAKVIICSVGKCPVDDKNPICCRHCLKSIDCESACKKTNRACLLQLSKGVKDAK
jgi:hypothetical protein